MPETEPKNCGMAGTIGVLSDAIVTCSALSHFSSPNLSNLFVLSLGLGGAGHDDRAA